jgi:hypothetical protein
MYYRKRFILFYSLLFLLIFVGWQSQTAEAVDPVYLPTADTTPEQDAGASGDKLHPIVNKEPRLDESGQPLEESEQVTQTLVSLHDGPFPSAAGKAVNIWPTLMLAIIILSIIIYWMTIRKSLLAYWH